MDSKFDMVSHTHTHIIIYTFHSNFFIILFWYTKWVTLPSAQNSFLDQSWALVIVGFLWVLQFPPTHRYVNWLHTKVHTSVLCPAINKHPIQVEFPIHAPSSRDNFWIYNNPDQSTKKKKKTIDRLQMPMTICVLCSMACMTCLWSLLYDMDTIFDQIQTTLFYINN